MYSVCVCVCDKNLLLMTIINFDDNPSSSHKRSQSEDIHAVTCMHKTSNQRNYWVEGGRRGRGGFLNTTLRILSGSFNILCCCHRALR